MWATSMPPPLFLFVCKCVCGGVVQQLRTDASEIDGDETKEQKKAALSALFFLGVYLQHRQLLDREDVCELVTERT